MKVDSSLWESPILSMYFNGNWKKKCNGWVLGPGVQFQLSCMILGMFLRLQDCSHVIVKEAMQPVSTNCCLSSIPRTHIVQRKHPFPKVVLWLPQCTHSKYIKYTKRHVREAWLMEAGCWEHSWCWLFIEARVPSGTAAGPRIQWNWS